VTEVRYQEALGVVAVVRRGAFGDRGHRVEVGEPAFQVGAEGDRRRRIPQLSEDVGRDYGEIERTSLGTVHLAPGEMGVDDVIGTCHNLAGAGIQHAIFNMPNVHDIEPLETFGREIIPAVADL
jgi:hypothetical protein